MLSVVTGVAPNLDSELLAFPRLFNPMFFLSSMTVDKYKLGNGLIRSFNLVGVETRCSLLGILMLTEKITGLFEHIVNSFDKYILFCSGKVKESIQKLSITNLVQVLGIHCILNHWVHNVRKLGSVRELRHGLQS
ncbi:hypothetical protein CR513_01759, partial [Mucuna pruriens]